MNTALTFGKDDIFLLGNIAARAISEGRGAEVMTILKFIQTERHENAGVHMLQAVYLYTLGRIDEAIAFLEDANVFEYKTNGPEVFAFFLLLLKEQGQTQRVLREAADYRSRNRMLPESARYTIETILSEIAAESRAAVATAM
jgi:Flp pilus assembly protein TadD